MKSTQRNMETAENANRNLELANYIWEILKTRIEIIMSWGIDPGKARVIKNGMELHVMGFLHTGFLQITLNEGTDLFEITHKLVVNKLSTLLCSFCSLRIC